MSDTQYDQWQGRSGNAAIDDPQKRLMSKLGKLLEVRDRAATEGEAANAATILSRFLDDHNLSIADIEKRGQAAPGVEERGFDLGKAAFKWKLNLADGIAQFYYAASIVDRQTKKVAFVGRPDNIEALSMLYGWVIDQVKQIATAERRRHFDETGEHIDPLRWQVSFGEGAVERLIIRLKEMKARQQEDMSRNEYGDIVGLVVHHATEASDFLEAKYGYRKDGKRTRREQDAVDRYNARAQARDDLKSLCEANGDMEPYYAEFPWDRPLTPEQEAEQERETLAAMKKLARNRKRRTGGGGREAKVDERKEDQAYTAKSAGRSAADKVNLQPFIGWQVERKKVG